MRISVVAGLDALQHGDVEMAHSDADDLLLAMLRSAGYADVAEAWERAAARCGGFWYA